ncbi:MULTISPECIES: DUF924 family protein [unclassified Mesorhizobium]|uniref:DUF924 family protein n=1 Tax=unclassified Mesorhizobium TaxID=325217 RepID=UPI001127EF4A|nr:MULTISPECIES: DUF924 family protein [unclassified Mesorhizobium]MBZ9811153.1 DUF924 family protein [Mesorhizobium sp. ESP-6-2]TPM25738.1 DUF924 family protein [Mesorhizobium sp. B2-2-2]
MIMQAIKNQNRKNSSGFDNVPHDAAEVIDFWWLVGPTMWFAKDAAFDRVFRERFLPLHEAAARGDCDDWAATPYGALALLVLLDQFPRNAFRGTPRMYATDKKARRIAAEAVDAGFQHEVHPSWRLFFALPFAHSENLADQDRSVALSREIGPADTIRAEHHRDIVRGFGRFPHRNAILGRQMRPEEQRFLDDGGFAG